MKIRSKDFRVREGDDIDLKKWPTMVDPVYKSKEPYQELLTDHVASQLSAATPPRLESLCHLAGVSGHGRRRKRRRDQARHVAFAALLCEEIKSELGITRVRGDTFGYLQRSFAGCVSDVDRREAREVGEFAVKQAIRGGGDGSVAIRRIGDYAVDYVPVDLDKIAGKTKVMADAFIAPSGSDVTPAFREYLRPLLGSDLPQIGRLRGGAIAKVLQR